MLDIKLFYEMLKYSRPSGSKGERRFISRFIDTIEGMNVDGYGNRWIQLGDDPTTMFSSHTDTVHAGKKQQKLLLDEDFGFVYSEGNDCLGADDCTGVFILLNLIDAGVKGLYVFHRDEEVGGGGSDWFSKNMISNFPTLLRCIAFDRKGYDSVITHQIGGRCCSDAFADDLCVALGKNWLPDSTGTFTDSANYTDYIGECTNLSVGYFNQHTAREYQDVPFLENLITTLLNLDWDSLSTERRPGDYESAYQTEEHWWDRYAPTGKYDMYNSHRTFMQSNDIDFFQDFRDVEDYVYSDPDAAVRLICDLLDIKVY